MGMPSSALSRNEPTAGAATRSPLATARLAGLLYLLIAAAAAVAHAYVPAQLIVAGDAAATVGRIAANAPLFRLGIVAEYVILLSEVALCVLLYVLFRPVSVSLALMMTSFRLVMTAIHGANMLNQFVVLNLSGGGGTALPFAPRQRESLVALFPDAYGACSACCCSWRAAATSWTVRRCWCCPATPRRPPPWPCSSRAGRSPSRCGC